MPKPPLPHLSLSQPSSPKKGYWVELPISVIWTYHHPRTVQLDMNVCTETVNFPTVLWAFWSILFPTITLFVPGGACFWQSRIHAIVKFVNVSVNKSSIFQYSLYFIFQHTLLRDIVQKQNSINSAVMNVDIRSTYRYIKLDRESGRIDFNTPCATSYLIPPHKIIK